MALLNIVSFNCNGLSDVKKLSCIFALCNERKYDVVCLQETFWNDIFIERIRRDNSLWDGEIFYSNGMNNRQGVAVLICKKLKGLFHVVQKDRGRFIYVKGKVEDKCLEIYNVYAPNDLNERCDFFLNM